MDASYCTLLQVSCALEGEVSITVGQTEVLCRNAGQQVGCNKWTEALLEELLQMICCMYVPLIITMHTQLMVIMIV